MSVEVSHLPEQSRFQAEVDGSTAVLTYERAGDGVAMTHTLVPAEIGGRGVAAELARTAVEWARSQELEIEARCSYVRGWLARHG